MNTTQTQETQLQTSLPAAIKEVHNKVSKEPKVVSSEAIGQQELINIPRKIYDILEEAGNGQFLSSEMSDSMVMFGYKRSSVQAAIKELYDAGKLTRSQKMPYAYSKSPTWEKPSDTMVVLRKSLPKKPVSEAITKPLQIPSASDLTNSLKKLAESAGNSANGHYGFMEHDLDLIVRHLTDMRKHCATIALMAKDIHHEDRDLVEQYGDLQTDIDVILKHMADMKKSFRLISKMAHFVRSLQK